jgi:hypothetical protein
MPSRPPAKGRAAPTARTEPGHVRRQARVPDAGTPDGASEQLSRELDVHSVHLADSDVRPAWADIDAASRPQPDPAGRCCCCMETSLNAV